MPEFELREQALGLGKQPLVIDGAGGSEHHVRRLIMGGEIGLEMGGLESLDALRRAEDRPPRRLVGKGRGLHQVEHHVLGRILGRGDLLQDHVALAGKLGRGRSAG